MSNTKTKTDNAATKSTSNLGKELVEAKARIKELEETYELPQHILNKRKSDIKDMIENVVSSFKEGVDVQARHTLHLAARFFGDTDLESLERDFNGWRQVASNLMAGGKSFTVSNEKDGISFTFSGVGKEDLPEGLHKFLPSFDRVRRASVVQVQIEKMQDSLNKRVEKHRSEYMTIKIK